MPLVRTRVTVSGFTESEVLKGLSDLLSEFRERPWLLRSEAAWDAKTQKLVIIIDSEGDDPSDTGEATFDEVWDCIIACLNFSSEGIHFDIEESAFVPKS